MKFRYSALDTAHFCNLKYKLRYVDNIPAPGLPQGDTLLFGTAMHLVMETHFDGGDALEMFKSFWKSVDVDKYSWGRYSYDDLRKIGEEFTRKWLKSHAEYYKPIHVEQDMEFQLNGFTVTGKPDFVGYYRDKLSIVDWKTSASDFPKQKALINSQMWIYVHGVKQIYNLGIEQVVYAPLIKYGAKIQTPIVTKVTPAKLKNMLDNATMLMRDLSTRTEFPRNERNCLGCEYFNVCNKEMLDE